MKKIMLILGVLIFQSTPAFTMGSHPPLPELETVKNVNLKRYTGKWYEIARLPQTFEKNCVGVTAEYALREDGKVDVTNTCRKYSCEGQVAQAKGVARVIDAPNDSKLKVSFFWPFEGDYWILELDPDYLYAVVGSPDRKSFWILSREPSMSNEQIEGIVKRFELKSFQLNELIRTESCGVQKSVFEGGSE